jgi:transposase-like protein
VASRSLREWHEKYAPEPEPCGEDASVEELTAEVKRLRKQLQQAEREREILKKSTRISRKSRSEVRLDSTASRLVSRQCHV